MCTYESASTILVLVTFSIVNFVFPFLPAILPIALDKWSPFNGFTSKREIGFLFQLRLLKFLLLTEHPNIKIILYFYLLVYWNYTWPLFALYYQEIKINLNKVDCYIFWLPGTYHLLHQRIPKTDHPASPELNHPTR